MDIYLQKYFRKLRRNEFYNTGPWPEGIFNLCYLTINFISYGISKDSNYSESIQANQPKRMVTKTAVKQFKPFVYSTDTRNVRFHFEPIARDRSCLLPVACKRQPVAQTDVGPRSISSPGVNVLSIRIFVNSYFHIFPRSLLLFLSAFNFSSVFCVFFVCSYFRIFSYLCCFMIIIGLFFIWWKRQKRV